MVHSDVAVIPKDSTSHTEHERSAIGTKACRCCSSACPLLLIDAPVIDSWLLDLIFNCYEAHHHLFRLLHDSVRTCLSAKQIVMGGWGVVQKCRPVRSIGGLLFSFQPISFLHHSQPLNAWKREFSVFSVWCVSFIVKINLFGTGRSQCQCIHSRDAFGLNG